MSNLELPTRLFAAGHEVFGKVVNAYQKVTTIENLIEVLEEDEIATLKASSLGNLFNIPLEPAWSARFGLFLLSRQLVVDKKKEIWIVFAGYPIRFSLREFKIVTGLACRNYPTFKKRTAEEENPFYHHLFGHEKNVTVDRVIEILRKSSVTDRDMRLRYACLEDFLAYPWGRRSFEMIMSSIKERNVTDLATSAVVVQGFVYALQWVVLKAVPAILESSIHVGRNRLEEDEEPKDLSCHIKVWGNAKKLDQACEVEVKSIICPEIELDGEDLSWHDETEDVCVENMVKLVKEGFPFKNEMFTGGYIPSELEKSKNRTEKNKGKRARVELKQPRNVVSSSKKTRQSANAPEIATSSGTPRFIDRDMLSELLDEKLEVFRKRIVDEKLEVFRKRIVDDIIHWCVNNLNIQNQQTHLQQEPRPVPPTLQPEPPIDASTDVRSNSFQTTPMNVQDPTPTIVLDQSSPVSRDDTQNDGGGIAQAEFSMFYSKRLQSDLEVMGNKIKQHEDNLKYLKAQKNKLDETILELQVNMSKIHSHRSENCDISCFAKPVASRTMDNYSEMEKKMKELKCKKKEELRDHAVFNFGKKKEEFVQFLARSSITK